MADVGEKAAKQLQNMTECPICMSDLTDPRILPCIHTFCIECLKRTGEEAQMKPGCKMPCPLCRKEFIVPVDGMNGVQKNFFMENLLEFKTSLQIGSDAIILCDTCDVRNKGRTGEIPKATMRCLECQDNYCHSCVKVHQYQKLSKNHQFLNIGSDAIEMRRTFSAIYCSKHTQKILDYYCADCKKIVCVSCFVESHNLHKCKDVTTVDEEFRKTIQRNSSKISIFADEMLSVRRNAAIRKAKFMKEIVDTESEILRRNQELKNMIDENTKSLLNQLSSIKSNNLKQIESEMEEIDRSCTILKSFEAYCTEVRLKGSASDICSSVDQLLARADDLERDHEAIIGRQRQSVEVTFQAADLLEISQKCNKNNLVGEIKDKPGLRCKLKKLLPQDVQLSDLAVKFSDLKLGEILGSGYSASVYAGTLSDNRQVAVKSLKAGGSMTVEEFRKEAETMHKLRHPNLVSLLGISEDRGTIYIITEKMLQGSLHALLRRDYGSSIKFEDLMHMAIQVVEGMCYLERKGFVHRDLRAANVLVGDGNITKIARFGLTRRLDRYYEHEDFYHDKKGSGFPYKWTAPESIKQQKFTVKSDVWSFGILLYEMVTYGDEPYAAMSNHEVLDWVLQGNRLKKPADQHNCPMTLYNIMKQCWLINSSERPNFADIRETLLEIKAL